MKDRNKPGLAFWATVMVAVVLLYVATIGPASRLEGKQEGAVIVAYCAIYSPIIWIYHHGPEPVHEMIHWYVELWN